MARKKRSSAQNTQSNAPVPPQSPVSGGAFNSSTAAPPKPTVQHKPQSQAASKATPAAAENDFSPIGAASVSSEIMDAKERKSVPTGGPVEVNRGPEAGARSSDATKSPVPPSPPSSAKQPKAPGQARANPLNAHAAAFTPAAATPARHKSGRSEGAKDQPAPAGTPGSGQAPATPSTGTPDQPATDPIPTEPGRSSSAPEAAKNENKGGATPEMLSKTIKSALNSLRRGFVSTAYAELLQAVSPESPKPDEKLEADLEQVASLVADARRLMKGHNGKQVLQKLDDADKLYGQIANELVNDASTSSAHFASQRLRLRAHAKLFEYEEVDRLSESLWEAGVLDSPEVFARMEAAWFLARFEAAADAARFYSRHPDLRDPHSAFKKTRSEQILAIVETRRKGTDAFKRQKWDRAISFYVSALRAAERVGCGEKTLAALNFNLGMAHLKAKHFSSAGDHFDWALDFDDKHIKALRNRAIVSEHLGQFDDALADLRDALELSEETESAVFCAAIERDIERIQSRLDEEDDFLHAGTRFFYDYMPKQGSSRDKDQHFRTLGISPGSSETEIKTAFRSMARLHHPDKGGDAEKFKEIRHAYGVLIGEEQASLDGPPECTLS